MVKNVNSLRLFNVPTLVLQWDEVSGHTADGNESRMLQVCEVAEPNQDNWVRSHFIDNYNTNQQLQRVFIEVEFAIR